MRNRRCLKSFGTRPPLARRIEYADSLETSAAEAASYAERHSALVSLLMFAEPVSRMSYPSTNSIVTAVTQSDRKRLDEMHYSAEFLMNIPMFDGTETPSVADEWISRFEILQHRYNWYDSMALNMVRGRLVGRAADWFTTSRMELMRWPRFCLFFKLKYVEEASVRVDWAPMFDRVQGPREPAYKYAFDKEDMCADIGLNFEYTKQQIILGLRSKHLAREIQRRAHKSSEELLKDLVKYEKAAQRRSDRACKQYLATIGKS